MQNITTFDFKDLNRFEKIVCLVSGGIDSTYLFEMMLQHCDVSKIVPLNNWNPFEQSATLNLIKQFPSFIQTRPKIKLNYQDILQKSFLKIPEALQKYEEGTYHKKLFSCCYYIKERDFKKLQEFKQEGIVIISGIKWKDGKQRRIFLSLLAKQKTFYHKHKTGHLYCYPFRDYRYKELPDSIVEELRIKYPTLTHSGCRKCPVLVTFGLTNDERYSESLAYYQSLNDPHYPFKD